MLKKKKPPERELNQTEISKLPDAEFKTLVIRILRELKEDYMNLVITLTEIGNIKMEIENIKKNQSEMKNIITNA